MTFTTSGGDGGTTSVQFDATLFVLSSAGNYNTVVPDTARLGEVAFVKKRRAIERDAATANALGMTLQKITLPKTGGLFLVS